MRVVFTPWPTPSHLNPMVPLAWALQSAGHEVCVAAHPALADAVAAVGLTAVSLGSADSAPALMGPGRPTPPSTRAQLDETGLALGPNTPAEQNLWDVFCQFMLPPIWDFHPVGAASSDAHPVVDEFVDFCQAWKPDLVVWDACFPAGAIGARVSGAAHARLHWGLDYFAWTLDRIGTNWNPLAETVRPAADRHGVEVDRDLLLGQWTIDPLPAGMRLPVATRTVPMRWIPYSGQTAVPDWLYAPQDRPRVGLSLGQSRRLVMKGGWDHVPGLLEMVSEVDVDVVATLNETQLAGVRAVPDNVRVVDYVPLNQLLPTCAALIHHGGVGTFSAAAGLRVPQLILDSGGDEGLLTESETGTEWALAAKDIESSDTAAWVVEQGAGLTLDFARHSIDAMRKRVMRVITEPSFAEGAQRLRLDAAAAPSPGELVPVLTRLVEQQRAGA